MIYLLTERYIVLNIIKDNQVNLSQRLMSLRLKFNHINQRFRYYKKSVSEV
jgi:hypothetical protein